MEDQRTEFPLMQKLNGYSDSSFPKKSFMPRVKSHTEEDFRVRVVSGRGN